MTGVIFTWNLRKDIEAAKGLINSNKSEVLMKWYGEENYNKLLMEYPEGGHKTANEWVRNSFIDSMDNIIQLLQTITDETQDNQLVQKRLKAIGFAPQK